MKRLLLAWCITLENVDSLSRGTCNRKPHWKLWPVPHCSPDVLRIQPSITAEPHNSKLRQSFPFGDSTRHIVPHTLPDAETTHQIFHKHEALYPKRDKTALSCQVWFMKHSLSTLRQAVNSDISFTGMTHTLTQRSHDKRVDDSRWNNLLFWCGNLNKQLLTSQLLFSCEPGYGLTFKFMLQSMLFLCVLWVWVCHLVWFH